MQRNLQPWIATGIALAAGSSDISIPLSTLEGLFPSTLSLDLTIPEVTGGAVATFDADLGQDLLAGARQHRADFVGSAEPVGHRPNARRDVAVEQRGDGPGSAVLDYRWRSHGEPHGPCLGTARWLGALISAAASAGGRTRRRRPETRIS